jgi:hypothetical protein
LLVSLSWPNEFPSTLIVAVDLPIQVFRLAVSVGRLVDFLTLGRIQFLVLLIVPTYPLRSVQTPNQARTRFFRFCGVFDRKTHENSASAQN